MYFDCQGLPPSSVACFSVAAAFDFRLHVCCLEKKLNATHVSADKHSLAHSAATVAVVSLIWSPSWKPCTPVANCSILSQPGAVAVPVIEGAVVTTPPGAELPFAGKAKYYKRDGKRNVLKLTCCPGVSACQFNACHARQQGLAVGKYCGCPNPLPLEHTRCELAAQFWLPQGLHVRPLLVPEQVPALYWLGGQLMLEQALQAPGFLPDRQYLGLQATLEISSHVYPLDVPLQLPVRRWPSGQSMLLQAEHAVLDAPDEHPPLLYGPTYTWRR